MFLSKGVTGSATIDATAVEERVEHIRALTELPVGVGFGIRDSETARAVGRVSDAIIVGSVIVDCISRHPEAGPALHEALDSPRPAPARESGYTLKGAAFMSSWLDRIMPGMIRSDAQQRSTVPEGLWKKCPKCNGFLYRPELDRNLNVCPKCDHHIRIAARRRLEIFLDKDEDSWKSRRNSNPLTVSSSRIPVVTRNA